MAQVPSQKVQVVPQHLSGAYMQHLYPQQQMLFPGNLTFQHAGMTGPTLQNIGAAQGLSLQLQAKTSVDNRSGNVQNIQPVTNKVQVIPQPLSASYLQHMYPQQILFPGNLTLQHGGMTGATLQNIGAAQGLSLQLQAKASLDNRFRNVQNIQPITNKVRPGMQTVAVATQTIVSSTATVNSNTTLTQTQIKPKPPKLLGAPGPTLLTNIAATQTNQSFLQAIPQSIGQSTSPLISHQKLDASNQIETNQGNEVKLITDNRIPVSETKYQQFSPVLTSTAPVSTSVSTIDTVSSTSSVSQVPSRDQVNFPELESETFKSSSVITESLNNSVASQDTKPMDVPVQEAEEVLKSPQQPILQSFSQQIPLENEHLKPHQPIVKPSLVQVKEKTPQKAIVKPQVLTHVIDGFLLQDGPEPLPVKSAQKRKETSEVSPEKKLNVYQGRGRGRRRKMRGRRGRPKQVQVEKSEEIDSTAKVVPSVVDVESTTFSNEAEDVSSAMDTDRSYLPPVSSEKEVEMQEIESVPPSQKLPTKWSVQEVFEFIRNTSGCAKYADTFQSQEIDGQSLLLLKHNHLMTSMNMKLGPALKLMEQIDIIKEKFGLTQI